MNNLVRIGKTIQFIFSSFFYKTINSKLIYFILPVIYFVTMLHITNISYVDVVKYSYTSLDSYKTLAITEEDKLEYILNNYDLSRNEFNVLVAIVLSEAEYNSYEDAYAVINTIYNRTHSKNWISFVNKRLGKGKGNSLYYQAIAPSQFTVYRSGAYKKNLNNTSSNGYKAIIDFLYTEKVMHNYLSFRSHSIKKVGSVCFTERGNNYFNIMQEENRV